MKKENKKRKNEKKAFLRKKSREFLKRNYIYIIMVALVVLRVGLGYAIGAWYGTNQLCDDLAMFNGLTLHRLTEPDELSLIKDLSFSLFLGLSAITNLPYTIVLSLFWALTALIVWLLVRKITNNKWARLFAFVYVLFLPTAFEAWGGLRVYRNSIIVPCVILTFSLALMLLVDLIKGEKIKKTGWTAFWTGIAFAFTYFLQESGDWIKLCMLVIFGISLAIIVYRLLKKKVGGKYEIKKAFVWLVICLMPFAVLFVWENVYRGINYAIFGVYETNTRTRGELAEYVEKTYVIDSPNRNKVIWSPYDAIEKTFEASSTLKSHPELLKRIRTSAWSGGDMEKNPLSREYLGWALRTELTNAGLWTYEKDVSDLFKQVNSELDEAFKDGTLQKDGSRIQIMKSAGAYTWNEIFDGQFVRELFTSFRDAIWLEGYNMGFENKSNDSNYFRDGKILHMLGDVNIPDSKRRGVGKVGVNVVAWTYRVVNIVLVVLSVVFVVSQIVKIFKNWKKRKKYIKKNKLVLSLALSVVGFFGVAVVYSLAMSWFFTDISNRQVFIFYRIGMSGLLALAYISAVIGVIESVRMKKPKKRKAKSRNLSVV